MPTTNAALWAAMRSLTKHEGAYSIAAVRKQLPEADEAEIEAYLRILLESGAVERPGASHWAVDLSRRAPPRPRLPSERRRRTQQLWTALRALRGRHTARELALSASTDEVVVKQSHAIDALCRMAAAGYVHVDRSVSPALWWINRARDIGPTAPVLPHLAKGGAA